MFNHLKSAKGAILALFCTLCMGISAYAQNTVTVSGRVFDDQKEPIPGAYVFALENKSGVVTAVDGSFSIAVPEQGHLTVQFMGMETKVVSVGNKKNLDIVLSPVKFEIMETVVTGYQTISKERSAGSFSAVRGAAIADKANTRGSIIESLEGATTGILVNMNTTASESEKYIVRGINTINSNKAPLFVVDGVAVSGESIEALLSGNDLASVTILKDATAASIWGSQAANGVVVIETKTGRNTNGKYSVTYTGSYTYKGMPDYGYTNMMDSPTFIKNALEVFDPTSYKFATIETVTTGGTNFLRNATALPHEIPMYAFANGTISEAERDAQLAVLAGRDWWSDYSKNMMSNAWMTRHQVSIEGGTANSKIYSSIGYEGNQGNNKDFTGTVRMNLRGVMDINEWLRVDMGLNAALAQKDGHGTVGRGYGRMMNTSSLTMSSLPYAALYDADGNALDFSVYDMSATLKAKTEAAIGKSLDYHPAEDFNNTMVKDVNATIRANAGITIKLMEGLKYEGRFAYSRSSLKSETYYPDSSYLVRYALGWSMDSKTNTQYGPATGGDYTAADSYTSDWTVRNQLSLDRTFNKIHQIAAIAGVEIRENHMEANNSFQAGYDYQTMTSATYDITRLQSTLTSAYLSPAMGATGLILYKRKANSFTTSDSIYRYFSMYVNGAYTYAGKYSVNASVRVDQSNLFGTDASIQFKPIWSVGAAWNAKKESFLKNVEMLNELKVRASYGLGGNSPTSTMGGPYNILTAGTPYQTTATGVTYYINSPANDKIHWEKTSTINGGIDFSMFRHRIWGSIDLYSKNTTDLLDKKDLDPTVGFTSVTSNMGEISNSGIELSLGGYMIRKRDISWDATVNFSYNKNEVKSVYHAPYAKAGDLLNQIYVEGYPMRPVFAYTWAGLDPEKGTPRILDKEGNPYGGSNSTLTTDDVKYMGTTIPPFFGSISSNLRYRNVTLSMMFVYNFGHKIYKDQLTYWYDRLGDATHSDFDKRWREPGDEAKTNVPSYLYSGKGRTYSSEKNLYMYSDIHVLDGAFIKLRELKLSYDVPTKLCHAANLSRVSVFGMVNNLFCIAANDEGIDPEWSSAVGSTNPMKMGPAYSCGLTVRF